MSRVPREMRTITVAASKAAALQKAIDKHPLMGRGRGPDSGWADMFHSAFVDEDGKEWRVASGYFTMEQIAAFESFLNSRIIKPAKFTVDKDPGLKAKAKE